MRYRLAIFDFDGTLADSFSFFLDSLDMLAQAHDFNRFNPFDLERIRRYDTRQLLRHFDIPLWKVPRLARHFQRLMAQSAHIIRPFEGVPVMLEALHNAGLQAAVVTSNSSNNVRRILGESSRYLSRIECGAPLQGKSSRLKRIASHLNTMPEAVMCIGDELRDIQAARKAGFACGAVSWGYASPDALCAAGPDYFFERIEDITHTFISHPTTELA